jgi:hypothetical protein
MKTEEMQLGLQTPLNTENQSLCGNTADAKKNIHGEFDLKVQGVQVATEK